MAIVSKHMVGACGRIVCAVAMLCGATCAQSVSGQKPAQADQSELDAKIQALSESLDQTRLELSKSREEIKELRSMLEQVIQKIGTNGAGLGEAQPSTPASQNASPQTETEPQAAHLTQDDWQIINARVDEMAQDKVESNLKYRLKVSGIVLLNAFGVSGQVDNLDVPSIALPHDPSGSSGSVAASLRQSIIELTGIGPRIFGADTVGDVQADFFGGLPGGYAAHTSGLMRLRIARLRMDWAHTSIFGGLDVPFFSPNLPTSYMSVAVPSFAAAGNLWTWTPTIGVEQRFDTESTQFKVQAGVMDPPTYERQSATIRTPSPSENSRQPTYAFRLSANGRTEDRPISFGISGIYAPQRFDNGIDVNGWGATADWRFRVFPHAELSGEVFVGKGIDSFGGVPTAAPLSTDYNYYTLAGPALERITMAGGWAQLKITLNTRNEFNFALGSGGRNSVDFRQVQLLDTALARLSPRNDMFFVNYIFRPRSDLIFSPEFRRLRTYPASGTASLANQVGLAAGFLF